MDEKKRFPAPGRSKADSPYRKVAPPSPAPHHDAKQAAAVPTPDVDPMDELARVEIDPRVVEERRSADRFWGGITSLIGGAMLTFAAAMDYSIFGGGASPPYKMFLAPHIFGLLLLVYGVIRLRSRGLEEM